MKKIILLFSICFFFGKAQAQNLPSLLLDKNINATFSILAYDEKTQEWGIAVATNNLYVGNSTVYIEPGVGAFSIIAETEPRYAANGFMQLKAGKTIKEAIEQTKEKDDEWYNRQVAGIDARGNVYAFTGAALKYWQGKSTHLLGDKFVVMGNQLADGVLETMAKVFREAKGTLGERLLKSLVAGQEAGGQIQGKQSAALVVKGLNNEWYNQIDLRVDNSQTPFEDLQKLLNYHYGRIRLNQATYAIRNKKAEQGKTLLTEAEALLKGWNGIYPKIAVAYLLLNNKEKAIEYIKKGLLENPKWKVYLPSFYLLKDYAKAKAWFDEKSFTAQDWASAVAMFITLNQAAKAVALSDHLLLQYPSNAQLYYLSAKGYQQLGNAQLAKSQLETALQLDANFIEAKKILQKLSLDK